MSSEMETIKPVEQTVEQTVEQPVVQPVVQPVEQTESNVERKTKPTFKELLSEYDTLASKIKSYDGEINGLKETIRNTTVARNNLERQRNKIYALFQKCHEDEVKKALKRKNKRKGNIDGGFNKELDVPVVLSTFFGVDKDTKMTRPKVMSMLNNKFKELGLKNGQITTLDEKTATALGKESGRVIQFTGFQSFLKEFYDAENTNILVSNDTKETIITV
jgi:predicted RNase H-like nuclease (RuvC/YqgF family)